MNLITRTLPALLLGLSGLTLSGAVQADSRFSVTVSSGYAAPHIRYAYHDSYRSAGRFCNPYRRPVHVDTYVEKRIYKDYGHHRRQRRQYDDQGYYGGRHENRKYRGHDGHHSRKHRDRDDRRHHTGYARSARY